MENQPNEKKALYKVVLVGDSQTGKTNILSRVCKDEYSQEYRSTIGIEFASLMLPDRNTRLQLWDTAGQERYRSISLGYYKQTSVVIIVYDITNRQSYDSVSEWYNQVKEHVDKEVVSSGILLVGNKSDLSGERKVTIEEAEDYAKSINAMHMEYSAKDSSAQQMIDKIVEVVGKVSMNA